ncbi:chitinase [Pigmentibacter sp. JX0631]|uniref:chitinase n=1 Tax=Pigmentibacter sp. JX0631 TaxID=2976982 RepID=UPI002468B0E1|nr:chitinase [Pigmentibacter sp. JX0631]WGL59236.1 chitinase [Pigmentibacter sp. JX0631]
MPKNLFAKLLFLIFFLKFSLNTFAQEAKISANNYFSPYNDVTVNAVWSDWQYFPQGRPADLLPISQQTNTKAYTLAFIQAVGNSCKAAWAGTESLSVQNKWGIYLTNQLITNSIKYFISLGGASGTDLSITCSTVDNLTKEYENIISTYLPNGLDFDLEGALLANRSALTKLLFAVKQIQNEHPNILISFTLPTMPDGLTADGQWLLNLAAKLNIKYKVNIMTMDYGYNYDQNMANYAIQAANSLYLFLEKIYPKFSASQIWNLIELTPMIGLNDVRSENFTLTDAYNLTIFAKQNNLGGLHMWSVSRDKPCTLDYVSINCSSLNNQKSNYEYMKIFANFQNLSYIN